MRRLKLTLRSAASALLAALLLVGAVSAGAAPSRSQQLRDQINEANDEFRRAGAAYDKAFWALEETEVRVEKADARLKALTKELKSERAQLSGRVEAWYRGDQMGFLEVLLLSADFSEFATRLDYVQRVSNSDAASIAKVKTTMAKIKREQANLKKERADQKARVTKFKRERDDLQARLKKSRDRYNALQAQLAAAAKAEKSSSYIPASSKRSVPVVAGPNGMVFPVAGPNYYSDTWGASRAGGRRRHKGTDIMASTGTPVVATLSGNVTVDNGGSAGLWIRLKADNGWAFWYMHLSKVAVRGGHVDAGDVIGYVGYSGNASASAPHLHYEIHPNGGSAVNPYPYLRKMQGR